MTIKISVTLEPKTLLICPHCSEDYGQWTSVMYCDKCKEEFNTTEKIVCDDCGGHFHEYCFMEDMD